MTGSTFSFLNGIYDISGNVHSNIGADILVTDYTTVMINSLTPNYYYIPNTSTNRFVSVKFPNTVLLRLTDVYYTTDNTSTNFSMNVSGSNDNGITYTPILSSPVDILSTNSGVGLSQLANISNDGLFNMFRITYSNTSGDVRAVKSQILGQLFTA